RGKKHSSKGVDTPARRRAGSTEKPRASNIGAKVDEAVQRGLEEAEARECRTRVLSDVLKGPLKCPVIELLTCALQSTFSAPRKNTRRNSNSPAFAYKNFATEISRQEALREDTGLPVPGDWEKRTRTEGCWYPFLSRSRLSGPTEPKLFIIHEHNSRLGDLGDIFLKMNKVSLLIQGKQLTFWFFVYVANGQTFKGFAKIKENSFALGLEPKEIIQTGTAHWPQVWQIFREVGQVSSVLKKKVLLDAAPTRSARGSSRHCTCYQGTRDRQTKKSPEKYILSAAALRLAA
uniref:Cell death inducing p53 target 1 n=1 Tax=Sus scrofa TaxID=9823 RepID=A0A8D1KYX9_PIG